MKVPSRASRFREIPPGSATPALLRRGLWIFNFCFLYKTRRDCRTSCRIFTHGGNEYSYHSVRHYTLTLQALIRRLPCFLCPAQCPASTPAPLPGMQNRKSLNITAYNAQNAKHSALKRFTVTSIYYNYRIKYKH